MRNNFYKFNLFFIVACVISFSIFCIVSVSAEERQLSNAEINQILATLEERSNAVTSVEFALTLDGETLPRFKEETVAREFAKHDLQRQFERYGKTLSLDDPVTNSKYENNVNVYLNGTRKVGTMKYEYSIIGNNRMTIKSYDTENGKEELMHILGRFSNYEVSLILPVEAWSNTSQPPKLNISDRTSYLRSSAPIFFHEVILENRDNLNIIGFELEEQYEIHAVTQTNQNNSYEFNEYTLYISKNKLNPVRIIGVLSKDGVLISRKEVIYDSMSVLDTILYPDSVLEIISKRDNYDEKFKDTFIKHYSVKDIHFNNSDEESLNFILPVHTSVSIVHKSTGFSSYEVQEVTTLKEYVDNQIF